MTDLMKPGATYRAFLNGEVEDKGAMHDIIVDDIVHILTSLDFPMDRLLELVPSVVDKLQEKYGPHSHYMTSMGIYALGRMAGIHAERQSREGGVKA